jgi:M6 family metalloprotease-like protein
MKKLTFHLSMVMVLIVCPYSFAFAKEQVGLGKKCYKIGKIQSVKKVKFICAKSGVSLRWTVLDSKPKKSEVVSPEKPKEVDLSLDPRITAASDLSDIEICKTGDLTPFSAGNNGFPRPQSIVQNQKAKILVLPVVFKEIPFTDNDLSKLNQALSTVTTLYSKVSMGRFSIEFEVAKKDYWVTLEKSATQYGIVPNGPQQNNSIIASDTISLANPGINFDRYDGVIIESGFSKLTRVGQAMIGETFTSRNGTVAKRVSLQLGESAGSAQIISHELGHTLFALEDLFVFLNPGRPSVQEPFPAQGWDIMSVGLDKVFGWNKFLMGWLNRDEIRCIQSQKETTHFLYEVDNSRGPKLVLINLSYGKTIAVEVRNIANYSGLHLIAYKIDSAISHGDGPITAGLVNNIGLNTFKEISIQTHAKSDKGILFTVNR